MKLKNLVIIITGLLLSLFLFVKLLPLILLVVAVVMVGNLLKKVRYPRIKTTKPNRHITKYKGNGSFINKDELIKR